jgi:hypothetical protein
MTRMHADVDCLNALPRQVVGCAFTVLNPLGSAFPEKVHGMLCPMNWVMPGVL